jgi:hypothetical protein
MKNKNLNEEISRIKSLFTEERLYGNLCEKNIINESQYKRLLKEDENFDLFKNNIEQMIEQLSDIDKEIGNIIRGKLSKEGLDYVTKQTDVSKELIGKVYKKIFVGDKDVVSLYGSRVPKFVNNVRQMMAQLRRLDNIDVNKIKHVYANYGYNEEDENISTATYIINDVYESIYGNTSFEPEINEPKTFEPEINEPKKETNLFDEPFDMNISGTYYKTGFTTYRSGGVEIHDVRTIIAPKRPLFKPIFTDSAQTKRAFGSGKSLPEKKVFTLIDGLTIDGAGRFDGAHTISFVFDKDSKITLDDVKGELEELNKKINVNYKEGKDKNISFEEKMNNYNDLYTNHFFYTKFKPNAMEGIKKMIDDYVKKHNKEFISEKWSKKYKKSIDCNNPKGFSQRAHCQGRKKNKK